MPLEEKDSIPRTKDHPLSEYPLPGMHADAHAPLQDVEHLMPISPSLIHCDGRGMDMGGATLPLLLNHHRHLKKQRLIGERNRPPLIEISPDDDRHLGRTTVIFFDGHVEPRELSPDDLPITLMNPLDEG